MNQLYVGFHKNIELPKPGYLYIHDEIPTVPQSRTFDTQRDSFNPLSNLEYKSARELVDSLYAISPQGADTLTVRDGKRGLLKAFLKYRRLDLIKGDEEVRGMVGDLLASPVLKQVLCAPTNFSFNPRSTILARLNRKELGDFDCLVLGLFLIAQFKGQLVIPDFGFYGKSAALIREERLIAGINSFDEVPKKLRSALLSIKDKRGQGAIHEDAETLAVYEGLVRGTNGFNDFVENAMR